MVVVAFVHLLNAKYLQVGPFWTRCAFVRSLGVHGNKLDAENINCINAYLMMIPRLSLRKLMCPFFATRLLSLPFAGEEERRGEERTPEQKEEVWFAYSFR